MRRALILSLFIVQILRQTSLQAQQLLFFKPENLKQLPASETYNIMQDSRGYIWLSTEAGLCRYNGDHLKVFDKHAGLPAAATYNVKEDQEGRLWATTSKSHVLQYSAGSFKEAAFSQTVQKEIRKTLNYTLSQMCVVNDSVLLLSTQRNQTFFVNVNTNKVTEWEPPATPDNFFFSVLSRTAFAVQIPGSADTLKVIHHRKWISVGVQINGKIYHYRFPYNKSNSPSWRCYALQDSKQNTWIGIEDMLIKVDPAGKEKFYLMPGTILCLASDNEDGIWLGLYNQGVRYYANGDMQNETVGLPELSVSGVCVDREGSVWCTTLEKGVFYCRNKTVIDLSNREEYKKPGLLKCIKGHLFTSIRNGELQDQYKNKLVRYVVPGSLSTVSDIIAYRGGWLLSSVSFVMSADTLYRKTQRFMYYPGVGTSSRQLAEAGNGDVYGLNYGELLRLQNGKSFPLQPKNPGPGRCLAFTKDNRLLLGTRDGLFEYKDSAWQKIAGLNSTVSKILCASNGLVWIISKEEGVFLLGKGALSNFDKLLHLKTKRFSSACEDKAGNIWLASNIGLVKIISKEGGFKCVNYNNLSGLPGNEILALAVSDTALYFTTPEGVCSFSLPEKLANIADPRVSLEELLVNGKLREPASDKLVLPHDQNTIRIKLGVFTYKRAGTNPNLFYIVQNQGLSFQTLRTNELLLSNLAPGLYDLSVYTLNNDGLLSSKPLQMRFEIQKPFWQKPLFLTGLALIFIALIGFMVRALVERVRKKEEEKTRINKMLAEYHMAALRAQMNPHFIFNCINSIQRYILTKKSHEAYNYLTKFSRLIRLVLNYAEKNLITLEQELEIVELYTQLEQVRFDNKFSYEFHIATDVKQSELYVPVLIIQPYIENAIWHGIMNMEGDRQGHISINISLEGRVLLIVVKDNGVGRKKAASFSKKDHESKATWINNKRAEIINMTGANVENVTIEDVCNAQGEVAGTRVLIRITQTHKNQIS